MTDEQAQPLGQPPAPPSPLPDQDTTPLAGSGTESEGGIPDWAMQSEQVRDVRPDQRHDTRTTDPPARMHE